MEYDLRKKYQKKSDKELYLIFSEKKNLGEDTSSFAEEELKNRNFHFENIEKYQKKWELEKLIEEERNTNSLFRFGIDKSRHFLLSAILCGLTSTLFIFDYFYK